MCVAEIVYVNDELYMSKKKLNELMGNTNNKQKIL
jgi:hypothetical protein